ncbi:MAG: flagellar basal body-associated FliL family protein [Actinomycetota bacterium]
MADDAEDEEEEEGGGGKKKIFMIVGLLAVVGAAYQFVLKPSPPPDEMAAVEEEEMEEEIVEGEIVELEEMILNIGTEEDPGFLRIGLALVLDEMTVAADFEAESAIAKDVAIQYLSSVTRDQMRTAEGRNLVKEELSMLIRAAYDDEKVVRVLFTALVMQ